MAIKFGNIEGKAKKSTFDAYTYIEGDNKIPFSNTYKANKHHSQFAVNNSNIIFLLF